jgi:hypothetical protein
LQTQPLMWNGRNWLLTTMIVIIMLYTGYRLRA